METKYIVWVAHRYCFVSWSIWPQHRSVLTSVFLVFEFLDHVTELKCRAKLQWHVFHHHLAVQEEEGLSVNFLKMFSIQITRHFIRENWLLIHVIPASADKLLIEFLRIKVLEDIETKFKINLRVSWRCPHALSWLHLHQSRIWQPLQQTSLSGPQKGVLPGVCFRFVPPSLLSWLLWNLRLLRIKKIQINSMSFELNKIPQWKVILLGSFLDQ